MYVDPRLPRRLFGWRSRHLGLEMPLASYGDRGHPLLLFPTTQDDFLENERNFLIRCIERHILAGKCRVFCIEGIGRHAWMNRDVPIQEAARRQARYACYVEEEVVPYIRSEVGDPEARIAVSGASFGAFYAANELFRRPQLFDALVAMSGLYDLEPDYTKGYVDDNVYFNNPVAFLANLHDEGVLHLLRERCQIHLVAGRGEGEAPQRSEQLAEILRRKGIPHNLDLWGCDVDHDWAWWQKMLDHYIGERLGW